MRRPTHLLRRPRLHRSEDGYSLVLVLAFITLFGISIAATLSWSDASYRASLAIDGTRTKQHAVDGAVQGAINYVRQHNDVACQNDSPETGDAFASVPFSVTLSGLSVDVSCQELFSDTTDPSKPTLVRPTSATTGPSPNSNFKKKGKKATLFTDLRLIEATGKDKTYAQAELKSISVRTATLSGYINTISPYADLESVVLRVGHLETTTGTVKQQQKITVTGSGVSCPDITVTGTRAWKPVQIYDLSALCSDPPATGPEIAGLSIKYSAWCTPKPGDPTKCFDTKQKSKLDGIEVLAGLTSRLHPSTSTVSTAGSGSHCSWSGVPTNVRGAQEPDAAYAEAKLRSKEECVLTMSGYQWPFSDPNPNILNVAVRVVHAEEKTTQAATVDINSAGGLVTCSPIAVVPPTSVNKDTLLTFSQVLPAGCAPDTQAKMDSISVVYTAWCTPPGPSNCHDSDKRHRLDAVVFDFTYTVPGTSRIVQLCATIAGADCNDPATNRDIDASVQLDGDTNPAASVIDWSVTR
jgi:hypothetical protein